MTIPRAFKEPVEQPIRFLDGLPAPHSIFVYNGEFKVAESMSRPEFESFVKVARANIASSSKSINDDNRMAEVHAGSLAALVWTGNRSAGFDVYNGNLSVNFLTESYEGGAVLVKQRAHDVLGGMTTRQLYEIPTGTGVCLPRLFIADDGKDYIRNIGVTLRLKDHPDVTAYFLDKEAFSSDPQLTFRQKNEFVWGSEYGIGKRIKLHGLMPYHSVTLDGREGIASSATITRDDDSTDYGYLATVQGDPAAVVDTPNLLLLVERNVKYAKGYHPVSAEELDRIAEGIAASIRRRPIQ